MHGITKYQFALKFVLSLRHKEKHFRIEMKGTLLELAFVSFPIPASVISRENFTIVLQFNTYSNERLRRHKRN